MATHGHGALTNLIRSRSTASLHTINRRPASIAGRDNADDEEVGERPRRKSHDGDEPWQNNARRESILNGPQIRSMRLIGNSNPRYRWHQYWKTEEELKEMKKPMYVALSSFSGACAAIYMISMFEAIVWNLLICSWAFLRG